MKHLLTWIGLLAMTLQVSAADDLPTVVRSAGSGAWSAASTWEGGRAPGSGQIVLIRTGHRVVYDVSSNDAIRAVHIAGTLSFATDKDTLLCAGLIDIQRGESLSEDGFHCNAELPEADARVPQPALEVGTLENPVAAEHNAVIRLTYSPGMNPETCPAIVDCGGRMDFHGAPMKRTWVKLAATAKIGESAVQLQEAVSGWRAGDHVVLTATTRQIKLQKTFRPTVRDNTAAEERTVSRVDGTTLVLDKPLEHEHYAAGDYCGEVANLSRNVIVESADPRQRGHTMYHKESSGSISYAEFRHLGKEGVLGKYSLHYHLCGNTMRGSSVIGASIWDSANRWLTIHGTNYLVVRDCVGYRSIGHGFFLEDGTEEYNVLDRNIAIQACGGKPLPKQVLPFDHNDGAGFWWANSLNTFTRNVACECDEYGYRFDAVKTEAFDPQLNVLQPDASYAKADIRKLPFIRFEDNESHCQRRHALNLGGFDGSMKGSVEGVGPDARHPFQIRNMKVWNVHWAFHSRSPSMLVDGMKIFNAEYGPWRQNYDHHAYRGLKMDQITINANFTPTGTKPDEADFPKPLDPVDDLPPATVIVLAQRLPGGKWRVHGTTSDNGTVAKVSVNGFQARGLAPNFAEWEIDLSNVAAGEKITAFAEDAAGNIEKIPHVVIAK